MKVYPAGRETRGDGPGAILVQLWEGDRVVDPQPAPTLYEMQFSKGLIDHSVLIERVKHKSFEWRCSWCLRKGRTAIVPYNGPDPKIPNCECGAVAEQPPEAP